MLIRYIAYVQIHITMTLMVILFIALHIGIIHFCMCFWEGVVNVENEDTVNSV